MHLTAEIISQIAQACQEGGEEIAQAFSRALDCDGSLAVGEAKTLEWGNAAADWAGPALVVSLWVGERAVVVVVPQASGLLPDWVAQPDPTGESKLATLGQELGVLLLPPDCMAENFKSGHVADLKQALEQAGVADGTAVLPLSLIAGETTGTMYVLLPVDAPQKLWETPGAAEQSQPSPGKPESQPQANAATKEAGGGAAAAQTSSKRTSRRRRIVSTRELPLYTRSLLRIRVPVVVSLAETRQPLGEILQLAPGAILQFSKSCEEPLELQVGSRTIARGEAVKVGDKFGLRIQEMVLPQERFVPLKRKQTVASQVGQAR